MDERDLETLLSRRLHARFDGAKAPETLRTAVVASLASKTRGTPAHNEKGYAWMSLPRQLLAAAAVVVIVAVIALAGRFGPIGQTGTTPSPSSSPSASATPGTSGQPTVGPSVAPSQPTGSVPPLSTSAWTGLTVTGLTVSNLGGPGNFRWAGGYLALGPEIGNGPFHAWESPDGRTWAEQPASLLGLDDPTGNTLVNGGTGCGDKVLVEIDVTTPEGVGTVSLWSSSDGITWTQAPFHNEGYGQLVGWGSVAIAAVDTGGAAPNGMALDVTTDCATWQRVALPGPAVGQITSVSANSGGFVAVGSSGEVGSSASQPLAWWSSDGQHWSAATVPAKIGYGFNQTWAGSGGFLATMTPTGSTPGMDTLWTSTNGHSWALTGSDPLATVHSGEGLGSYAGMFDGDGTRLLAFGAPGGGSGAYQYWVSSDGTHWTQLDLTGPGAAALKTDGEAWAALMRDGILFVRNKPFPADQKEPAWFGAATP